MATKRYIITQENINHWLHLGIRTFVVAGHDNMIVWISDPSQHCEALIKRELLCQQL
jgi:hypothetical protein